MCEIRTGSAIRAPWTVLGWRFILGGLRVCRVGLQGFGGFQGEVMRCAAEKHQSRQRLASGLRFELRVTRQVGQQGRKV